MPRVVGGITLHEQCRRSERHSPIPRCDQKGGADAGALPIGSDRERAQHQYLDETLACIDPGTRQTDVAQDGVRLDGHQRCTQMARGLQAFDQFGHVYAVPVERRFHHLAGSGPIGERCVDDVHGEQATGRFDL